MHRAWQVALVVVALILEALVDRLLAVKEMLARQVVLGLVLAAAEVELVRLVERLFPLLAARAVQDLHQVLLALLLLTLVVEVAVETMLPSIVLVV
jgi:hypothetical protein